MKAEAFIPATLALLLAVANSKAAQPSGYHAEPRPMPEFGRESALRKPRHSNCNIYV